MSEKETRRLLKWRLGAPRYVEEVISVQIPYRNSIDEAVQ